MVTTCSAIGCKERATKGNHITFHKFPLNPIIRDKWIKAIKRRNYYPTKNARICEKHFARDCYVEVKSGRKILRSDAIPDIFDFYSYVKAPHRRTAKVMDREFEARISNEYRNSLFTYSNVNVDDSNNENDRSDDYEDEEIKEEIEIGNSNSEDEAFSSIDEDEKHTTVEVVNVVDEVSESHSSVSSDEPENSIELDEIDQLQLVDTVKTMNKKLMNRLKTLEVASTYYKKKQSYLENALKKVNTNYNEFVVDASKILDCFIEEENVGDSDEPVDTENLENLLRINKEKLGLPTELEDNEFMLFGIYVSFFLNALPKGEAKQAQKDISLVLQKYNMNRNSKISDNLNIFIKLQE